MLLNEYTVSFLVDNIIVLVELIIIRIILPHGKGLSKCIISVDSNDLMTNVIISMLFSLQSFCVGYNLSHEHYGEYTLDYFMSKYAIIILAIFIACLLANKISEWIYSCIERKLRRTKHSSKKGNPCLSCPDYDEYMGCTIADLPFSNPDCPKEGEIP